MYFMKTKIMTTNKNIGECHNQQNKSTRKYSEVECKSQSLVFIINLHLPDMSHSLSLLCCVPVKDKDIVLNLFCSIKTINFFYF